MASPRKSQHTNVIGRRLTEKEYNSRLAGVRAMHEARGANARDKRMVHWLIALIRDERMRQGISIPLIAAAAGLRGGSWSNYEDGRNTVRSLMNIEDVLAFLGYRLSIEPLAEDEQHHDDTPTADPEQPPHMVLAQAHREGTAAHVREKHTTVEELRAGDGPKTGD